MCLYGATSFIGYVRGIPVTLYNEMKQNTGLENARGPQLLRFSFTEECTEEPNGRNPAMSLGLLKSFGIALETLQQ